MTGLGIVSNMDVNLGNSAIIKKMTPMAYPTPARRNPVKLMSETLNDE